MREKNCRILGAKYEGILRAILAFLLLLILPLANAAFDPTLPYAEVRNACGQIFKLQGGFFFDSNNVSSATLPVCNPAAPPLLTAAQTWTGNNTFTTQTSVGSTLPPVVGKFNVVVAAAGTSIAASDGTNSSFYIKHPTGGLVALDSDAGNTFSFRANGVATQVMVGTLARSGVEVDTSYLYNAPLSGATVTMAQTNGTLILEPAATLAALTIVIPTCSASFDGQIARYSTTQAVTTLTVSATAGTIADAPTTIALGGGNSFICRGSVSKWYRLY